MAGTRPYGKRRFCRHLPLHRLRRRDHHRVGEGPPPVPEVREQLLGNVSGGDSKDARAPIAEIDPGGSLVC
jgi:hypothetical protein